MSTSLLPFVDPSEVTPRDLDGAALRLVSAVQALSLARKIEDVIEIVRKAARDISRADGASFILRDGDKCHYVDEDAISPLWKGQRFPMSACVSGWAMINRKHTVIPDIYVDERIPVEAYRPTFVKSMAMIPIRTEEPIGAIGIYWATPHLATAMEVELLQALANTTSVALENIRLYDEMEQRVEDRTRQLAEANRDLESFSYSVSHDLQAPLRHIKGYVNLLCSDLPASLDDRARDYLSHVEKSTARMSELIGDLLRLAKFSRVPMKLEPVNLSELAREVIDNLRKETPARSVEFILQSDMEVIGDRALLRIQLENLLGNAWKFTSKRKDARIEFGTLPQPDGSTAYFIKDNGSGFDMRYMDKLFGPFQRLHHENDFEGTGIGLATVEKIVRRHGGRIWAHAIPDQGATFTFTLAQPNQKTN